ncbi:hypothetical protein N7453_002477 [Penicillium expansum]|nr:hypothetical protein N7453_002477 [Penicillium expansum]
MADPLSIASGVAGFLSLGIEVTKSLVEFYSSYKGQTAALAKITLNLENLLGILRSLDDALQNRQPQTDALVQEIEKVANGCREIIEELRDECQKFQEHTTPSLKARIQLVGRRATYPFRESTLKKLEEDIGEIRENLSLALNVLQLRNQTGLEYGMSELKILAKQTNTMHISAMIRGWLMAPDATLNHNAACEKRHKTTGLWLINGQKFQNWLVERNSFLWINGFAGCGKSVLCSTAIERTFRERQHQPSLSAQLEGGEKDLQELHMLYKSGTPPVDILLNSLRQTICKFSDTYILLDALDESPRYDKREGVLGAIKKMRQWDLPTLHLLVTSRNEIDIRHSLETPFGQDISMKNPDTDIDIENFISYQLSNDPKFQKWKSRHEEIQERLTSKAQGVFRYVECQLLALKRVRIRNQLDKCLRSLPRDLDETYERMLCSIDDEDIEEARLVLTLLCVSNRPLTVKELTGALAIDVKASEWQLDREGRSFSQDDIVDICLGLIEIAMIEDEDSGEATAIARIAHFSVQEYLESDRISQQGAARFTIQKEPAHTEMAQICLFYLLEPTLSSGKLDEAKLEMFPLTRFAAAEWLYFYNNSGKGSSDIEASILRLFKDHAGPFVTWIRLHNRDSVGWRQIADFGRAIEIIPLPLYYAALLGLEDILSALLANGGQKTAAHAALNNQAGFFGNALQAAAQGGYENIVQTLLDQGADIHAQGGEFGNALQAAAQGGHENIAAAQGGHENIVQTLLDQGADINTQGGEFSNALQAAAQGGYKNIVQTLLDQGADIYAQGGTFGNALQAAAQGGHENIVQTLLDQGADINTQGGRFSNALQAAAYGGHDNVVQTLLYQGADINAQGGTFGNALQAAAQGGHENLVQTLLDQGADINAQGGIYSNALQAAVWGGYEKVVQTLLDQGADIHAQGGRFGNALQAATLSGHENLVQTLLDQGADINAQRSEFGNALQAAVWGGHENIVQTLLDQGADINAQGGRFGNALQAAAWGGHENIVQTLLDQGADINAQGGRYGNALYAASSELSRTANQDESHEKGVYEKVVQILLDHGADANASGPLGNAL